MAKGGGSTLDKGTQQYQNDVYNAARSAAGLQPPPGMNLMQAAIWKAQQAKNGNTAQTSGITGTDPTTNGALGLYGQGIGLGGQGLAALGGDPTAIARLMNPYQSDVIDATGRQYDTLRGQASMDARDQATQARAFGGSRAAIVEGQRLGELDKAQANAVAGLNYQGYRDAIGQAGSLANFGFGAAGAGADLGRWAQLWNDPATRRLMILQMAQGAPQGQAVNSNRGAGALGGALTGAQIGSFFPGPGTAIGAGLGGLIGLLG